MKRIIGIIIVFLLCMRCGLSQEVHFSQFYMAPLQLNPALTGAGDCYMRIGGNYSDQWRSVSNPYKTYSFFGDGKITSQKLQSNWFGIGLQFYGDRAGTGNLSSNDVRLTFAYHKGLMQKDKLVFSIGIALGYMFHSIEPDRLTFETQWTGNSFDGALSNQEQFSSLKSGYFDVSSGLLVRYSISPKHIFHFGGGVSHLTNPKYSFLGSDNRLAMKTTIHAGYNGAISKTVLLAPKFYYSTQDKTHEFVLGTNMVYRPHYQSFYLGLWYRWSRDIIPTIGMDIEGFNLMLSYDINVSKFNIATKSSGGFEIALIKTFLCDSKFGKRSGKKNKKSNIENCPIF